MPGEHQATDTADDDAVLCTAADDAFFSRCHDLPWTVELTAEWPNGRVVLLPTCAG